MAEIVTMPKLGFDMAEGTLVRWVIAEGEAVNKGAVLAEIETDKATVEVEASASGTLLRHLVEPGNVVPVNTPIAVIGQPGEEIPAPSGEVEGAARPVQEEVPETTPSEAPEGSAAQGMEDGVLPGGVRATPLARRLAQESGIDLRNVRGSGPLGRIRKEDVEAYLEEQAQQLRKLRGLLLKSRSRLPCLCLPLCPARGGVYRSPNCALSSAGAWLNPPKRRPTSSSRMKWMWRHY